MVIQPQTYTLAEFDEFVQQPDNRDRLFEYIAGEIVEVVSNPLSSKIAMLFGLHIGSYLQENDIGHVTGADGGYAVSGERYIPDVGFISYGKQRTLSYDHGYVPAAPDLVVAVLSPGNDDAELSVKVANYLAAGTVVWLARPLERRVQVFAPGLKVQTFHEGDELDGGTVLPGFRVPVYKLFPPQTRNGEPKRGSLTDSPA